MLLAGWSLSTYHDPIGIPVHLAYVHLNVVFVQRVDVTCLVCLLLFSLVGSNSFPLKVKEQSAIKNKQATADHLPPPRSVFPVVPSEPHARSRAQYCCETRLSHIFPSQSQPELHDATILL